MSEGIQEFKQIQISGGKAIAIIDSYDYEIVSQYSWHLMKRNDKTGKFYARALRDRSIRNRYVFMHRLVMAAKRYEIVDHINGDILDNRRSNLRLVTAAQNQWNMRSKRQNSSSRFKGVYWNSPKKKWEVGIRKNGKKIWLGSYDEEELAARIYNTAASFYFGEYAGLNLFDQTESKVEGLEEKDRSSS